MGSFKYVGVDGCPSGWFSIAFSDCGEYEVAAFADFPSLVRNYGHANLILVDIPIGLPTPGNERECDRVARQLLGKPRSSSIFPAPLQQVADFVAQHPGDYSGANYLSTGLIERGLSKQSFAIIPKVIEVDRFMAGLERGGSPSIREVHPELCFWALNDGHPMASSKKTLAGRNERLQTLTRLEPASAEIFAKARHDYLRRDVQLDDICDALAAAITAFRGFGQLNSIPDISQWDSKGIPMEMVYWRP